MNGDVRVRRGPIVFPTYEPAAPDPNPMFLEKRVYQGSSGRVYPLADASLGAIKPGDLLTSSATPGHCMKASDRTHSQGAIIGKAMSGLTDGKGMVLVLVSLQ